VTPFHSTVSIKKTGLSFYFQMVAGVLRHDLVNNYHVFKLDDGTVLPALKEALRAYIARPHYRKE
tara:strand:- start:477 stop:671 length:195 start_codon:yes stop_codon:yes gene_type:complete